MFNADELDKHYWKKMIVSSIAIAAGSALANEVVKVVGDKLRERWAIKQNPVVSEKASGSS